MSYDFCILGKSGAPEQEVSLGVEIHHAIMEFAQEKRLKYFLRAIDYYQDAEYQPQEIKLLIDEVKLLKNGSFDNSEVISAINELFELFLMAQSENKGVFTIAD